MMVLRGHVMTRLSSLLWSHSDRAGPEMTYYDSSRNGHVMTKNCCSFWSQYDLQIYKSYRDGVGPSRSGYDLTAAGGMA